MKKYLEENEQLSTITNMFSCFIVLSRTCEYASQWPVSVDDPVNMQTVPWNQNHKPTQPRVSVTKITKCSFFCI